MSDLVVLFNRLTPRLEGVLAHALSGRVHRLLSLNRLAETDIEAAKSCLRCAWASTGSIPS